jgi:histidinol-phosphatase
VPDRSDDPADDELAADDLLIAHLLADAADEITTARFRAHDLAVSTKPDTTPVTDADRAVETTVRSLLAEQRPQDSVLGEEEGGVVRGRTWVVDPIDGTKNYLRGVPVWATLIGLVDGDDVPLGLVSAPALGRRWWAVRSGGAWVRDPVGGPDRRCRVSDVAEIGDAFVSYASLGGWHGVPQRIDPLLQAAWRTRGFGDFWSYMLLAEGAVDVATEPELALHDMAALVPIVTEAGGRFTDLDGSPGPFGRNAVATNGRLHEQALRLLRS